MVSDNVIGVCPDKFRHRACWRVSNYGGLSNREAPWTEIDDDNVHSDSACMTWTDDGTDLYVRQ
jgi:hypothetical protein